MERKQLLKTDDSSATMLVAVDNEDRVFYRLNVGGWGKEECQNCADMYALMSRKTEISPRRKTADGQVIISPFLIDVYSVTMQSQFLNILAEYAPDGSLRRMLENHSEPIQEDHIIQWAQNTAMGLYEIHDLGYPHRHISTSSMFLTPEDCAKLGLPRAHRAYMRKYERTLNQKQGGRGGSRDSRGGSPQSFSAVLSQSHVDSTKCFPPEVELNGIYLGLHSDVWHWAVSFKEILGHRTPDWRANRNPQFVKLLEQCMSDEGADRPNLDYILNVLKKIRDGDALEQQREELQEMLTPGRNRKTAKPSSTSSSASPPRHAATSKERQRRGKSGSPLQGRGAGGDEQWKDRASMQMDQLENMLKTRQSGAVGGGGGRHQRNRQSTAAFQHQNVPHKQESILRNEEEEEYPEDHEERHQQQRYDDREYTHYHDEEEEHHHNQQQQQQQQHHPQNQRYNSTAAAQGAQENAAYQRKSVNIAAMQHEIRNLPKHLKMQAVQELNEIQQFQLEERQREQEMKRAQKELERQEAEQLRKEHQKKLKAIRQKKSGIKGTLREDFSATAAPGSTTVVGPNATTVKRHQDPIATQRQQPERKRDVGVLDKGNGVQIFVKNPATLGANDDEDSTERPRPRRKQQPNEEDLVNYVVEKPRSRGPRPTSGARLAAAVHEEGQHPVSSSEDALEVDDVEEEEEVDENEALHHHPHGRHHEHGTESELEEGYAAATSSAPESPSYNVPRQQQQRHSASNNRANVSENTIDRLQEIMEAQHQYVNDALEQQQQQSQKRSSGARESYPIDSPPRQGEEPVRYSQRETAHPRHTHLHHRHQDPREEEEAAALETEEDHHSHIQQQHGRRSAGGQQHHRSSGRYSGKHEGGAGKEGSPIETLRELNRPSSGGHRHQPHSSRRSHHHNNNSANNNHTHTEEMGLVAIVECNLDLLWSSIRGLAAPEAVEEVRQVIAHFSQIPAEDRSQGYPNKKLVEHLRAAVNDELEFPTLLPMLLQITSLEASLFAWKALNEVE